MYSAQMQVNTESLYGIFRNSYSASEDERRQAEAAIASAEGTPGYLTALLQIAVEPNAEQSIRQAAAIQLKNQVRRRWNPLGADAGKAYGEDDKTKLRGSLFNGFVAAFPLPLVRAQLLETFRLVASHDFPGPWSGVLEQIGSSLQSDDTMNTYCALLVLRKLFKQFEMRPVDRRQEMEELCSRTLPTLRTLGPALMQVASQPGPHCLEAFEMLKTVLKCFYSAIYMAVGAHVRGEVDTWMQLVLGVATGAAPADVVAMADDQAREASPFTKCRKWAFHILFRFMFRHGNKRRAVDGMVEFAGEWMSRYGVPVTEACIREATVHAQGVWVPKRTMNLALLCLAEGCGHDATYGAMRARLQSLLEDAIFPRVRFGNSDVSMWQEDPQEFVRQFFDDFLDPYTNPRAAAVSLVERLLRHREDEVLTPLLHFCRKHLEAHAQAPGDPELCANKDGALLILDSMSDSLLELEASSSHKNKGKKGKSKKPSDAGGGGGGAKLEELLSGHILPAFASPSAFLRMRACWTYRKFASQVSLSAGAIATACRACLGLMMDSELPVRIAAGVSLQAFLEREDDAEVRSAAAEDLPGLLNRLFTMMGEFQCEELVTTLEAVVVAFQEEIAPFAVQLVRQLIGQFVHIASQSKGGSDEAEGTALSSMQTVVTILRSCANLGESGEEAELRRRTDVFAGLAETLIPLMQQLLRPEGMDFAEEALEVLTCLTFASPSPLSKPLLDLFPQLYVAVCGVPSSAQLAAGDGWAPDMLPNMSQALEFYVSRSPPQAFLAGAWVEAGGAAYPEMLFVMLTKVLQMQGLGTERDCASAADLIASFFQCFEAPAVDAWLPRYFDELWRRFATVKTAELRRASLTALAAMAWYNAEAFLVCTEQRGCTQQIFEAWMQNTALFKSLKAKKVFLLGLVRVLQLGAANNLPAAVVPGLPHVVRQLAELSSDIVKLRAKEAAGDADEDEDDDQDDDDFADFDEDGCHDLDLQDRTSLHNRLDELEALGVVLQQAPQPMQQQVDAWLGAGVLGKWLAELDAEKRRRQGAA